MLFRHDSLDPSTAGPGGSSIPPLDWQAWLRRIERRRRLSPALDLLRHRPALERYLTSATHASFRLDGLAVTPAEILHAVRARGSQRLRSRQSQRIRNHVAILHHIELTLRRQRRPLAPRDVVRWYASVSSGLCSTGPDPAAALRLEDVLRRVESPRLRIQAALAEAARLHAQLLREPLVPSFNGILARLLLRYHLGRCGFPPAVFPPTCPLTRLRNEAGLLPLLAEAIDHTYDLLAQP